MSTTLGIRAFDTLLAGAAAYDVAVLVVAERFRCLLRHTARADVADRVGVSILVPLEGVEPALFENLAAYCEIHHRGPVQVVVGSLDPHDPALATARAVTARYPGVDFDVVAGAAALGPNRKASLLEALSHRARHPVIAAIDSDVRVTPDYLSRMLPALFQPGVGLVSCLYRAPRPDSLAKAYEALCINADFCPSVMLAHALGRSDIALGASLIVERATLDRVGGFGALVEYLADDHRLAELVSALGMRVTLASHVVESDPNPASLGAALRHQVRWARTVRACAPWGYAANIVTHGVTFALCALVMAALVPRSVVLLAIGVVLLRLAAATAGARALGAPLGWTLALVPFRDVAATAIWVASFMGDRVEWRGRHYRIASEGRLIDANPAVGWNTLPSLAADATGEPALASEPGALLGSVVAERASRAGLSRPPA
jgi:ceramide glucosyltransferase